MRALSVAGWASAGGCRRARCRASACRRSGRPCARSDGRCRGSGRTVRRSRRRGCRSRTRSSSRRRERRGAGLGPSRGPGMAMRRAVVPATVGELAAAAENGVADWDGRHSLREDVVNRSPRRASAVMFGVPPSPRRPRPPGASRRSREHVGAIDAFARATRLGRPRDRIAEERGRPAAAAAAESHEERRNGPCNQRPSRPPTRGVTTRERLQSCD